MKVGFLLASLFLGFLLIPSFVISADERYIICFENDGYYARYSLELARWRAASVRPLPLVSGIEVSLLDAGEELGDLLASHPGVISCEPTITFRLTDATYDQESAEPAKRQQVISWGLKRIGGLQAEGTGQGVKIAVMDTGIDPQHPDLVVRDGFNALDPQSPPRDDHGHGTHCAGIIAAQDNLFGIRGIVPAAELYAVKILDAHGEGSDADVIAGLDWCLKAGIQIINMSFGGTKTSAALKKALDKACEAGLVMVAAAGNQGQEVSYVFPASYPCVIAVSALNRNDELAFFSNFGPEIDFIAPGTRILSSWISGSYKLEDGTSQAAPYVTSCAALILEDRPLLSPSEVVSCLQSSSLKLPDLLPSEQGHGLVSAELASRVPPIF